MLKFIPIKSVKCDETVRRFDRHCNETVTHDKKRGTKYRHMRKCMVEFFIKFENRGTEIARVNSIRVTKSIKFTLILYGVGSPL